MKKLSLKIQKNFSSINDTNNDTNITEIKNLNTPLNLAPSFDNENNYLLNNFFLNYLTQVNEGGLIEKVNFRSQGIKIHFYKLDIFTGHFQIFKDEKSKKEKENYDFNQISKIVIGLKTKNILDKINIVKKLNNKDNYPYLFMSFIMNNSGKKKKTIDLIFKDDNDAKKWFYGLYCFLKNNPDNKIYKIGSCSKYILFRIKYKLIDKLKLSTNEINNRSLAKIIKKYFDKKEQKKGEEGGPKIMANIKDKTEKEEESNEEEEEINIEEENQIKNKILEEENNCRNNYESNNYKGCDDESIKINEYKNFNCINLNVNIISNHDSNKMNLYNSTNQNFTNNKINNFNNSKNNFNDNFNNNMNYYNNNINNNMNNFNNNTNNYSYYY